MLTIDNHFNPHSHEGSDKMAQGAKPGEGGISIHTPTKGVTLLFLQSSFPGKFQSTLPRRE